MMSSRAMTRHGLDLPTESQWEYGCRAGKNTVWFPGSRVEDLQGYANIAGKETQAGYPN